MNTNHPHLARLDRAFEKLDELDAQIQRLRAIADRSETVRLHALRSTQGIAEAYRREVACQR